MYTLQQQAEGCGLDGALELAWKKHILQEDIKFQLGSVNLEPLPSPAAHQTLLEHALQQTSALGGAVSELRQKAARLERERNTALARLEDCVSTQESLETELFAKFKLVLNDKKAKIRRLLSQLAEAPAVATETTSTTARFSCSPPSASSAGAGCGEETDQDDDEHHPPTPPPPALPPSRLTGDSLFETDATLLSPPAKRKRRRGQSKPATGLVPIPQPPSASRPSTSSSRARSASSTNQPSKRESDAEDLLGQL